MKDPRCAVVTGAAAGLGRELSAAFAKRGLSVVLVDIDEAGLRSAYKECTAHAAAALLSIPTDLTVPGGAARIVDDTVRQFGRIDVLVNCAAIGEAQAFNSMSEALWQRTFAVNVTALVSLTLGVANEMIKRQTKGRIVNITSPGSRMALPNYAAYAASKAAVDSFTRTASVALARHGIKVNSVAPGMMDTAMQRTVEAEMARVEGRSDLETFLQERTNRVPLGRRAEVSEVVDSIVWLALDAPDYVTCARLNVSGGLDKD
jgi:NAD(P)-dependent dehydrogenase (short-subunit alcohol dehydrogenase family)